MYRFNNTLANPGLPMISPNVDTQFCRSELQGMKFVALETVDNSVCRRKPINETSSRHHIMTSQIYRYRIEYSIGIKPHRKENDETWVMVWIALIIPRPWLRFAYCHLKWPNHAGEYHKNLMTWVWLCVGTSVQSCYICDQLRCVVSCCNCHINPWLYRDRKNGHETVDS